MYATQLLNTLEKIEFGSFDLTTPDKRTYRFEGKNPGTHAQLELRDESIIPAIFAEGNVALARTYKEGLWETENLIKLMQFGIENQNQTSLGLSTSWMKRALARFHYMMQRNSMSGSLRNISAHYDLGNDFYALWLDETMTYSAGIFNSPDDSLEQAQINKYDRILARLGSRAQNVLEIGCGWGGFAERLLEMTDHKMRGITLSKEQCKYANERLREHRSKCNITLQDYREQQHKYDAIVSIEMFEAVGEAYWPTYFNKIADLLEEDGKAIIQTITIDDSRFDMYRKSSDMIRSYIFPGGMLPSPSRFRYEAERAGLEIKDQFEFGEGYALTLEHWLKRFNENEHLIRSENRDDAFMRLWRFYLSFCIAGFRSGRTNVMQVELAHA